MNPSVPAACAELLTELRASSRRTQAEVARLAGTSQPAVARYESGAAVPSWPTLTRLVAAHGQLLVVGVTPAVDPHDTALVEQLLAMSPSDRLATLARFARLQDVAEVDT